MKMRGRMRVGIGLMKMVKRRMRRMRMKMRKRVRIGLIKTEMEMRLWNRLPPWQSGSCSQIKWQVCRGVRGKRKTTHSSPSRLSPPENDFGWDRGEGEREPAQDSWPLFRGREAAFVWAHHSAGNDRQWFPGSSLSFPWLFKNCLCWFEGILLYRE